MDGKKIALAMILGVVGCRQAHPPKIDSNAVYWIGDTAYIHGKKCGHVTRSDGHITGYTYVVSGRFKYDISSGGGGWPWNEYLDKQLIAEVEEYCATQFYYYGQDGENARPPVDRSRQIIIWDNMTHSELGGSK